ncbi:MAG: oligopeptide ABC transporter permease OppB [Geminicoccaceae bacterium]
MSRLILRRLAIGVPTLLIIITLSFFMMRLAPGGPFDQERPLPPEIRRNVEKAYHLDESLVQQYLRYLGGLLKADFGPSYRTKDFTVGQLLVQGAPASFKVGGLAVLLATVLGLLAGIVAALRHNSWADYSVMGLAMVGIAIPSFVMAPLLSLIFGVYLAWLPAGGWGNGALPFLILPVVSLALPQVAQVARLARGAMIEQLNANYVRTARAKGLRERLVLLRHALPGAMLPVVSYLGPMTAALVTGSVVVETIFSIPGIGRYFVQAALNRDYTVVMGVVIVYACLIIVLNLIVDLLYGLIDPKVRTV